MAYKFSVGAYAHSGSLSSTSDITGSTIVSGSTGQFGTLTVATFSPSTISTTSLTATTGSFTRVSGTFVDFLVSNKVPTWDDTNGVFSNSAITSVAGGLTTLSNGLYVTGSISSSVGISSSAGQFGTLTVATFNPATISTTSLTATTGSFTILSASALGGAAVSALTDLKIPNWDATLGRFENSYISRTGFGKTIVSGALGLDVTGAVAVIGTLSASSTLQVGGALTVAGATTLNGDLTVNGAITYVSSSVVEFKDVNLILASGSTTSAQVNGAGLTLGNTGYQLKFVSGSMGTSSDSWEFSSLAGYTDFIAGNITATSITTKIIESIESSAAATINISKYITLADSTAVDITANLPAAGPSFTGVSFKVKNVGTKSVFVKSLGGTIDGVAAATGVTLATQYAAATFVSDGTNWHVF